MNFANNLINLRKKAGLSQEELGNKIDVSRQTISKWELGTTTPELNKIIALSKIFNISTDKLLTGYNSEQRVQIDSFSFEYKSKAYVNDMPIVHINLGQGYKKARGIIAIGNFASGVISMGGFATGVIALGGLSAGVISLGGLAAGVIAVGGISFGAIAVGAIAIGYEAYGAIEYILKDIL